MTTKIETLTDKELADALLEIIRHVHQLNDGAKDSIEVVLMQAPDVFRNACERCTNPAGGISPASDAFRLAKHHLMASQTVASYLMIGEEE